MSPTLWCLVVNSLLEDLKSLNSFCIGYADDVVIIVRGRFINTISNIVTEGLRCVERGCNKEGLSVNPQKTTMVAFTNKKTVVENIMFLNWVLDCSENIKYLGMLFDSKLNEKTHFNYCLNKGKKVFWICRIAIGRTWGLNPKVIHWIYRMTICPVITYGSILW